MAAIRERNGRLMVVWHENGRQRGKTVDTMVEAVKLQVLIEHGLPLPAQQAVTHPTHANGKLTIAGYRDTYLASHSLSERSRSLYRLWIDRYLIPAFPQAMEAVSALDVRRFLRELEKSKSGAVVRKVRCVGASVWSDAITDKIVKDNPFHGQPVKRHASREFSILTPAEFKTLVEVINPAYRLLVKTLGMTGLRWSEALRLVPGDIEGNVLHVRQSKTGKSRRVQVPPDLAQELRDQLPFRSPAGQPVQYNNFRRWAWQPAVEGYGWHIHDLRHSHASWLVNQGVDLQTVRDRLGHSNINMTSRYLHSLPDAQAHAVAALDRALAS